MKIKILVVIIFLYSKQLNSAPPQVVLAELGSVLNNLESRYNSQQTPQWPIAPETSKDGIAYLPVNKYFAELVNKILPKIYNDVFFVVGKFKHTHRITEEEREQNEVVDIGYLFDFTVEYMESRIQELNAEIIKASKALKDSPQKDKFLRKHNLADVELFLNERLNAFGSFYKFLQDVEKYALYLIKTKFTKIVLFTKSKKLENIGKYDAFMESLSKMIKNSKEFINLVSQINDGKINLTND